MNGGTFSGIVHCPTYTCR